MLIEMKKSDMNNRLDRAKQTALDAMLPFVPRPILGIIVDYCRGKYS